MTLALRARLAAPAWAAVELTLAVRAPVPEARRRAAAAQLAVAARLAVAACPTVVRSAAALVSAELAVVLVSAELAVVLVSAELAVVPAAPPTRLPHPRRSVPT